MSKPLFTATFKGVQYKRRSDAQYRFAAFNPYRHDITMSPVSWHTTEKLAKKAAGQFGQVKPVNHDRIEAAKAEREFQRARAIAPDVIAEARRIADRENAAYGRVD